MKAILCKTWGDPDQLAVETVPDPAPGPGEVVVDVRAAALNYPDVLLVQGKYQARPPLPFTPGAEAAGVVSAAGEGVTRPKVGDRVIAVMPHGAFAEKVAVNAAHTIPIPEKVEFDKAAAFPTTYGTAYHALKQRAALQAGETLLVLGAAGGVGLAAVELGTRMGARVIAAASTEEKLDTAREAGASMCINYSKENLKDRIKALTEGRGVDVVFDPVGGEWSEPAVRGMAWGGRFLVIGFASGDIPKIPLNLPLLKGCSLTGVFWGAWLQREPSAHRQNMAELCRMLAEGRIDPRICERYRLEAFLPAFRCLTERRARGKVVFEMAG